MSPPCTQENSVNMTQRSSWNLGPLYHLNRWSGGAERYFLENRRPLGKINGPSGQQIVDRKVCGNVCLCMCQWSFCVLQGHKTPLQKGFGVDFIHGLPSGSRLPWEEICDSLISQKLLLFGHIGETPRWLLTSSVDSQLSAQNNFIPKWHLLGRHILIPFSSTKYYKEGKKLMCSTYF